mmetsp:Transcript_8465/g.21375  ORF Transcript_8465/g.21375 Transcript_8465/m.21375 type:complete len:876 (+) Transcript_8465:195-2822(+)|eukprot:CAMPEP_0177653650 /NCGR_PEP_ID=MMETSP0447-20121125/13862_1 /TAXON_ID=0 /ORGANISM="Stygamoeba regulata, Strain BSH-02190019" /LENGTH=875 /DNA_ID=CAMNT_0019157147 /DNA_START=197 /DNA_END=2824 /DNA_ORIENTATION=-
MSRGGAASASASEFKDSVIRLKPLQYIHVLDNNSYVTRVETGPKTFTRQEHERIVLGPEEMIKIPPRHYCVVSNPVIKDKDGNPVKDVFKNFKLRYGDEEVRYSQDPFILYPGESLVGKISPLVVVVANQALLLNAVRDFTDDTTKRVAGDEWLFRGPATYYPRTEVVVKETVAAKIIKDNQALRLRARKACKDHKGVDRRAGEEWLVRERGAYLPNVDEEVVGIVAAIVLTEKKALHLCALRTFTDQFGKLRKAGEEWLVTFHDTEAHIPDVDEVVLGEVKATTLNNRQYCVILDPVCPKTGVPQFGQRELRRGDRTFFLQPGESLESGIQSVHVLGEEEALLLRAKEHYKHDKEVHSAGDLWMISGPTEYIPPVQVEIMEKRRCIPLDKNEGIYVRNIKTGQLRTVCGTSYMLQANEVLWEKELPAEVEALLWKTGRDSGKGKEQSTARDKTRVVTYRTPHNAAVQIYDYKHKKSRVVFGPELVMLEPDEHFTLLSLSGGKPKTANQIHSLALFLGPDFMTDIVTVETADHARLQLQLAYNWNFDEPKVNEAKLFAVPDFVGDACKAIASRVRAAVAAATFDNFHRRSADIIHDSVFGKDPDSGKTRNKMVFSANSFCITNIDIQAVEPVDQRTKESLQKSVQLAIEITTKSQEATARHEAERLEQEAKGRLERQKIEDEADAEKARMELLQLVAQSAAVETTGHAAATAKARAQASVIEAEAAVKQSTLKADAARIAAKEALDQKIAKQQAEVEHKRAINSLEITKAKEVAAIEEKKFREVVNALGRETIKSIATAGPATQAKLLAGLGLKSFLITDGNNPVNLFNTANGLLGGEGGATANGINLTGMPAAAATTTAGGPTSNAAETDDDDF